MLLRDDERQAEGKKNEPKKKSNRFFLSRRNSTFRDLLEL